jgi:hypothetical protein
MTSYWPTDMGKQIRLGLKYIRERYAALAEVDDWYERGPLERWARAEAERTQPPVCDRPSCYDSPHTVASRIEHGCIPDWRRP